MPTADKEVQMSNRKIAVVSNANAGKNTSRAGLGLVIGKILATPSYHYDTATLAELDEAAIELNRDRPDIVVIAGGDGTVKQTITRILSAHDATPGQKLPQFLIIPTGTMNVVGTVLGLTRYSAVKMAQKMRAQIQSGRPLDVAHLNPIRVNDEYGFLYGSGLPVNLLERYYEDKVVRGPRGGLRVILQALRNEIWSLLTFRKSKQLLTKPVHARITLADGHDPPVAPYMTHTALMCGAVDEVGLGCRALPDAMSKPGHFMLRSTQLSFWGCLASAGAAWAGLPLARTFDTVVPNLVIDYQEPTVTMLDGEMNAPTTRDVLTSGPTLSFVVG